MAALAGKRAAEALLAVDRGVVPWFKAAAAALLEVGGGGTQAGRAEGEDAAAPVQSRPPPLATGASGCLASLATGASGYLASLAPGASGCLVSLGMGWGK